MQGKTKVASKAKSRTKSGSSKKTKISTKVIAAIIEQNKLSSANLEMSTRLLLVGI